MRRLLIAMAALFVVAVLGFWIVFSRRNPISGAAALAHPPTNAATEKPAVERGPAVSYLTDTVEDVPWTIHIVKVDRLQTNFSLETTLGRNTHLGMSLVSEQVKALPPGLGRPMAAVNGDFYKNGSKYPGDPEGIQIAQGELVSAPRPTHSCFWIDASGAPHITNIQSNFKVT